MEIVTRNLREDDIPSVVKIQIEGWKTAYRGIIDDEYLDSMSMEEKINKRKKDYQDGPFIVAEVDGEIVGFCRYFDTVLSKDGEDYDSELMALYVKPNLKQHGIGKRLFEFAKDDLRNQDRYKMILWCLKDNYPSRKFYEKMGGKVVGFHDIEIGGKMYSEIGFGYEL